MKPKTDRTKINRTTDADIRRHMIETVKAAKATSQASLRLFPHKF